VSALQEIVCSVWNAHALSVQGPLYVVRCFAANESTNSRVVWFSVLELVTMVTVGAVQIYFLRSFFEKKRKY
jgi:hypothetical protein